MKRKSTSRPVRDSLSKGGFFNLRALIGLCIVFVGACLALAGLGAFSAPAQGSAKTPDKNLIISSSSDPLVPVPFDCSRIHELGIDRQENFRAQAIMIACGEARGGSVASSSGSLTQILKNIFAPLNYGASDVNLITGPDVSPNVVQSETYSLANPENANQILVAYNDSRCRNFSPINIGGASWSTDGGNTFTRLTTASGCSPFAGGLGDPVVLYNTPTHTWFAVGLTTLCGGQGIGGYKTTTPGDVNSWTQFCIHNELNGDRESGWSDNNPASPFYGRLYVSWNDFTVGGGALFAIYSTDNGLTWTNSRQITTGFIRDVQITGDYSTGAVYIAGMNEGGGGFPHNDTNLFYRSSDGGNTWTNTYIGPTFPGPGRCASGYFATMYCNPAYWTHEGWGEPAALNGMVHYVYSAGAGSDPGNVYYIRSTDMGVTFSTPIQLNSDTDTTKAQWAPNLSISPSGTLFATWYDEHPRVAANCQPSSPSTPCYQIHARKSYDNGVTWLPDMPFSDVATPLPLQGDPGIRSTYAGDYDYASAIPNKHVDAWVDGRNAINGSSQQDAYFDKELVGFSVISITPACSSFIVGTPPTDFVVSLSDPADPATVDATDFTVNGTPANAFVLSNGNTTITFHFNTSPVVQGLNTIDIGPCAFRRASDGECVFAVGCTFRFGTVQLQVTTTNPPVGGTFTPPAPGTYTYTVNWNINVDPTSVQTTDLTISGISGASVTAASTSGTVTTFTIAFNFGGTATMSIPAGAVTDAFGNPNAAFSGNYTVAGCPPADHYSIAQIGGSIVPGTTDIGNHGDDQVTNVALPFPYTLYDQTYTSVNLSSNGNAQFTTTDTGFNNTCLPWTGHNYTIFPYWTDLYLLNTGYGIFTSVTGNAPNRIFNIEWRAQYFPGSGSVNFELRLYEGQTRFDVVYGTVSESNTSATAGVQKNDTAFDQYFCNGSGGQATGGQSYILQTCNSPAINAAVSRKTHGGAGNFDVTLPLTGTNGVECRTTGGTNDFTMVVTFFGNVTVTGSPQAQLTMGTGCVGSGGVCTGNVSVSGSVVTVPLTNIANAQNINVRINGVNSAGSDAPATDFDIPMGVLAGDTNANRTVNAADVAQTKGRLGQSVNGTNFRSDVNANGSINAADTAIIKQDSGTSIP